MDEQGWFTDPYGRHEARWMSKGHPTALVRDGDTEGKDDVPDGPPVSTPRLISAEGGDGPATDHVVRANEAPDTESDYRDSAEESIDSSW